VLLSRFRPPVGITVRRHSSQSAQSRPPTAHGRYAGRATRLVRVIRLARLIKLLRILRVVPLFKRLQRRLELRFAVLRIVKYLFFVLLATHWNACLWHLVAELADSPTENWLYEYFFNYLVQTDVPIAALPLSERYIASLYWAVTTITTIGCASHV
jgi:hypothetical protein